MGVITTVDLVAGTYFGPLPTEHMIADPAYLIAQTTNDILSEVPMIYVSHCDAQARTLYFHCCHFLPPPLVVKLKYPLLPYKTMT